MRPRLLLLSGAILVFAASAPAAEVDKYLLDDTDAVLGLDVKMLLQSPLVKKNYVPLAQKQLQSNAEAQKNIKELGFDPLKDVDRILLVHGESCHRSVDGKEQFSPLVIVRGRFDTAKIHTKAAQIAQFAPTVLKVHKNANGIIYELTVDKTVFIALPDRTSLVASLFKDQVSEALDKGANKKKTKLKSSGLSFLIEQTDNRHCLWAVALGHAAPAADTPLPTAKDKKVEKTARKKLSDSGIDELSGGLTVADGIKADFRIKVQDEETATTISDAVQMFLPQIVQGFKVEDKRLVPVREFLTSLSVARDVRDLIIRGDVSGKVFVESLK
jgi:hypothetical protein